MAGQAPSSKVTMMANSRPSVSSAAPHASAPNRRSPRRTELTGGRRGAGAGTSSCEKEVGEVGEVGELDTVDIRWIHHAPSWQQPGALLAHRAPKRPTYCTSMRWPVLS